MPLTHEQNDEADNEESHEAAFHDIFLSQLDRVKLLLRLKFLGSNVSVKIRHALWSAFSSSLSCSFLSLACCFSCSSLRFSFILATLERLVSDGYLGQEQQRRADEHQQDGAFRDHI